MIYFRLWLISHLTVLNLSSMFVQLTRLQPFPLGSIVMESSIIIGVAQETLQKLVANVRYMELVQKLQTVKLFATVTLSVLISLMKEF